jgi:hypothetical protein
MSKLRSRVDDPRFSERWRLVVYCEGVMRESCRSGGMQQRAVQMGSQILFASVTTFKVLEFPPECKRSLCHCHLCGDVTVPHHGLSRNTYGESHFVPRRQRV